MRLVCISDTHNRHGALDVPEGDVLLHAGDLTAQGTREEIEAFGAWLAARPHPHKVVIAGNHDWLFQREPQAAVEALGTATYLQDSGVTIGGLRFWGSPWQPWFMNWAFNLRRGAALRARWDLIPTETDVLITHGPPHGIADTVKRPVAQIVSTLAGQGLHVGCEDLVRAVRRVRPRLHVFGHIHEGYARVAQDGVTFVNASSCDVRYRVVNPPVVVDL